MSDKVTMYPHRRNEEGSYDSICRACFATVARGKAEDELAAYEEAHICDPIHMLSDLARASLSGMGEARWRERAQG